jgi:hypothetical protein
MMGTFGKFPDYERKHICPLQSRGRVVISDLRNVSSVIRSTERRSEVDL